MQEFFIRKDSVNPVLRMELVKNGKDDFHRSLINYALQDSTVTFNMTDMENGLFRVCGSPAEISLKDGNTCESEYVLVYRWKPRDVSARGTYRAWFDIVFNGNITADGMEFPKGNLIVPIEEELVIHVI